MNEQPRMNHKEAFEALRNAIAACRRAIDDAFMKALKPALAEYIAARKRIHLMIIAMIPQHLRGNPMCRDPWQRGQRA